MERYLTALIERDPKRLALVPEVRFTENGTLGKPGDRLWRRAARLGAFRHVFADTTSQQTLFLGTLEEEKSGARTESLNPSFPTPY